MSFDLEQRLRREIEQAEALHAVHGDSLRRDARLTRLLESYREAIRETWQRMHAVGVVAICSACASQAKGSCCFRGIEEGYDSVLLLINLLMGCRFPDDQEDPWGCFFVGAQGCKLIARTYFCVHYLCPRLQEALGAAGSRELQVLVGEELAVGWELEQTLRGWLSARK